MAITRQDTEVISSYLATCGFDERGDSWLDIASEAGMDKDVCLETIRNHVHNDENIRTWKAAIKGGHSTADY